MKQFARSVSYFEKAREFNVKTSEARVFDVKYRNFLFIPVEVLLLKPCARMNPTGLKKHQWRFPCVATHKEIRTCRVRESVENDFPVGRSRQGNQFFLSASPQVY